MTSKERVLSALNGKETDRMPWAPLVDSYYTNSLPNQGLDMNAIQLLKFIGADTLLHHVAVTKFLFENVEYKTVKNGLIETVIMETPVGTVISSHKKSGNTVYKIDPFIKNIEDVKVMQFVVENTKCYYDFDNFNETEKEIGDCGIASPSGPLTPIQQLLQHEIGIENFTYFVYDYPEIMEEFMQTMHDCNLKVYKALANTPENVKVIIDHEDTSTTVMGPDWYRKYCMDEINDYARIMRSGGKIFITHMCGKLSGLINEIAEGEMAGIDSVCPPTTGDLWAHDALEKLPGKIIIGGIEPPMLKRMTVSETQEYVENVINSTKQYKGFILSTGDATSYDTPIENLKMVTELVNKMTS